MKRKMLVTQFAALAAGALALAATGQAQTVTDPCPNRVISWNAGNSAGTVSSTDLAGLAPAVNWVNVTPSMPNYNASGLTDNAGSATTLNLRAHANNVSGMPMARPTSGCSMFT